LELPSSDATCNTPDLNTAVGLPSAAVAPPPAFADRSTGLLVFGIMEMIGGVLTLFFIPLMLIGIVMGRKAGGSVPASSFITVPLTYGGLAAVLFTLGIGATLAKRWAWALNLIVSWIWLVGGTLTTTMLVFVLPGAMISSMKQAVARNPNSAAVPSPAVMAVIVTLMIAFVAFFLIILPIAFLFFYRSRNVELTCKHRDPVERWTDRRPLPVLGCALLAAFGSVYYLVFAFTRPLTPFFGRYLTGSPAAAVFVAIALVDGFVSVSLFRMKVIGWWVAVVGMSVRLLAALLTIGRGNLLEAYSHIGWSQRQLEHMSRNPFYRGAGMLWIMVAFLLVYLVFLAWLKRYFRPELAAAYTEAPIAASTPNLTGI